MIAAIACICIGKTIKNFEDADHPDLLKLPFPDQTYSILQHWLSKESGSTTGERSERNLINHISHQHDLSLVSTQSHDSKGATSSIVSSLSCHDPMKMIELLCNGCVRPIMDVPFNKCSSEDQRCDFVLHEWCTRLPAELPNHPDHPQHTLFFVSKVPDNLFGIFYCESCNLYCNGFAYGCTKCHYYIDVNCGFIPEEITHEAHPDHILSRCDQKSMRMPCVAEGWYSGYKFSFSCRSCDFYLHSGCALFLPGIINHKLDKHPMKLTYEPVRPGKNKRKKGRKLDSGNQVRQRFRESFQEERAAIRGIVPKEKEGEQQYWELFPKEGRPIDSGNQSKKTAYRERQIQKREKDNRKRFRESFQEDRRQRFRESFQKKKPTIQGIVPRRRYKRFRVFVSRKGATRVCHCPILMLPCMRDPLGKSECTPML
ncbi:hypothetical protein Tco_0096759 [Tanacetum coccineum]